MDKSTAQFDADAHAAQIRDQGFTIVRDVLDAGRLQAFRDGLAPFIGQHAGRNAFEGFSTERVYTLVARGKVFEDLTEEPRLLAILDRFLQPGYLLTASQSIQINPGEAAQDIHTDDGFYRQPRPRPPISMTVIGAIDDFTAANGATEVIPASHLWGDVGEGVRAEGAEALADRLVPMEIPAGACLVMAGTCLHRGGANRTDHPRLAFTNQYCEPWARTQENFFLGIPPERVRAMSPRLQSLLGYDIWRPFMGMVSSVHPRKALEPGWVAPVVAQEPHGS